MFAAMSEHTNDTPWEPPFSGSEAEHVLGALDRLRWTFRWKADGLDAGGLATRLGPSTLTLGGLLKHLAAQEDYAIVVKTDGEKMPAEWAANGWDGDNDWEFSSAGDDSPAELYARYDAAVERARTRLAARVARGGLDQQPAGACYLCARCRRPDLPVWKLCVHVPLQMRQPKPGHTAQCGRKGIQLRASQCTLTADFSGRQAHVGEESWKTP
jgi:hypothetical protein